MNKWFQTVFLIGMIILITHNQQSIRYYLSYSSTTLYQVQDALDIIVSTISIPQTTFAKAGGYNLTLTNVIVTLTYLKRFQNIDMQCEYCVNVTNGRVEANFRFNFSRSQPGTAVVKGWGQGFKFVSEDLNYIKNLKFDRYGILLWDLSNQIEPVLLFDGRKSSEPQTLYPYNQADLDIINYMFTSNESVSPSSILSQLNKFTNFAFVNALKQSINPSQLMAIPYYTYTFNHPQRGNWTMPTMKHLFSFKLDNRGFQIGYSVQLEKFFQPISGCFYSQMPDRLDQKLFGGQQVIYHYCFFEQVVLFMYKKGWLNLEIDHTWNTAEFSFTVNDFAKIVPSLSGTYSSALPVKGTCGSLPPQPNKTLKQVPGLSKYAIVLDHTCKFYASSTDQHISPELFLQFTSKVQIIVEISQHYDKMGVSFQGSELIDLVNHKVKDYEVNQAALIKYFDKVMNSLVGIRLFGDGFAMLKSKKEQTRAFENYVVYSDMNLMSKEEQNQIVVQ